MCNVTQKNIHSRQTAKRILAFVCLLCILIAIMLSEALVLSHTAYCHDHDHGSNFGNVSRVCTLCTLLNNAGSLLKTLGLASGGFLLALVVLFAAIFLSFIASYIYRSPIVLRIRMNH